MAFTDEFKQVLIYRVMYHLFKIIPQNTRKTPFPVSEYVFNRFQVNAPFLCTYTQGYSYIFLLRVLFLCPLRFSNVLRVIEIGALAKNGLINIKDVAEAVVRRCSLN